MHKRKLCTSRLQDKVCSRSTAIRVAVTCIPVLDHCRAAYRGSLHGWQLGSPVSSLHFLRQVACWQSGASWQAPGCTDSPQSLPWAAAANSARLLQGRRFGDVFRYFPEGIVLGLLNTHSGEASLNPPGERVINADDCLVMLRSTGLSAEDYLPSEAPVDVDIGKPQSKHASAVKQCAADIHETAAAPDRYDLASSWVRFACSRKGHVHGASQQHAADQVVKSSMLHGECPRLPLKLS